MVEFADVKHMLWKTWKPNTDLKTPDMGIWITSAPDPPIADALHF